MPRLAAILLIALIPAMAESDRRNTDIPHTDTHFSMPHFRSLEEWNARREVLRKQILFAAGLEPMPARGPVRAEVFGRIEHNDYTVEKVLLETMPGYYLGGNIYRPRNSSGRLPAIATPHGHWTYGRLEHAPLGSIPARSISLARQGYVVLAYDMVGYNDTIQTPHAFGTNEEYLWNFTPFGLQLWNSLRVIDYLSERPDVDPVRIGATGASGGATQTFFLAAIDDRVRFTTPVNMISGIMQGGSPCENAPGLRVGAFNVEYGAMTAPRPMLMVSATGDWTRNTPQQEFPAVKAIYELYDRASLVENVHVDAPHNYNQQSREAMYAFFARHMQGASDVSKYKERSIPVEKLQDMLALHNRTLPPGALDHAGVFALWRSRSLAANTGLDVAARRQLLALALGAELPAKVDLADGALTRPGLGDRVPARFTPGKGRPVLLLAPGPAVNGRPTLAIEPFQTGSAVAPRNTKSRHFLTFNRTDNALRVQDILTAAAWLALQGHGKPEVIATGRAAIWATFAKALAPQSLDIPTPPTFAATDAAFVQDFFVPGIQRAGGWQAAVELAR